MSIPLTRGQFAVGFFGLSGFFVPPGLALAADAGVPTTTVITAAVGIAGFLVVLGKVLWDLQSKITEAREAAIVRATALVDAKFNTLHQHLDLRLDRVSSEAAQERRVLVEQLTALRLEIQLGVAEKIEAEMSKYALRHQSSGLVNPR